MPNYKTHLAGDFCAAFCTLALVTSYNLYQFSHDPLMLAWYLCCALAGSLFPDVDIKSKGQRLFYFLICILSIIIILKQQWHVLSVMTLVMFFPLMVPHRGITHQTWFVVMVPLIVPCVAAALNPRLLLPAFVGYLFFVAGALSHLILDFGLKNFLQRGLFAGKKVKRIKRKKR